MAALGPSSRLAGSSRRHLNLRPIQEVTEALARAAADVPPVLALVHGGGSGLEVSDDPPAARAALRLASALVTAIGHTPDVTLPDMVADRRFETPTRLGQHLRERTPAGQRLSGGRQAQGGAGEGPRAAGGRRATLARQRAYFMAALAALLALFGYLAWGPARDGGATGVPSG